MTKQIGVSVGVHVDAAGHEIGIHGYSHENPMAMTRRQETEILDYCTELIEQRSGRKLVGYGAHWWEFSKVTHDWVYREMGYAVFPITIHPDVSGRPQNLLMLERLFDHIQGHEGVKFAFMEDVARDFAHRSPRRSA